MNEQFRTVEGERTQRREPRFKLVPFNKLRMGSGLFYLVKWLVPGAGLILVWGPPKSGKSFWTFDLVMHVALNLPYRGRRVKGGPVVYCSFEGADGLGPRAEAYRCRHQLSEMAEVPFYSIATRLTLAEDYQALIQTIQRDLGETQPVAIVLDTLNRSLGGSESSDEDMGAYIRAADAVREAFSCAVIIVHHCGLDSSRPRGHTSLTGAVDAQLAVKRDDDDNVLVTVEWMKDGPEGAKIFSRLEKVSLGPDADGDPITSRVIVEAEDPAPKSAGAKSAKGTVTGGAKTAFRILENLIDMNGRIGSASSRMPQNAMAVSVEEWRQAAYKGGISASSEARARQSAFKRAFDTLVATEKVGVYDDMVWIIHP